MAWRDILVQVGAGPFEAQRLRCVARLAQAMGAALHGAYPRAPSLEDLAYGGGDLAWMTSAEVRRAMQAHAAEEADAARVAHETFDLIAHGSPGWTWCEPPWSAETWISLARQSDLTITGAVADSGLSAPIGPDRLACASGRPVLVLPSETSLAQSGGSLGRNVLLAWDGGREAARALGDAMPLIERADKVTILSAENADAAPVDHDRLRAHLAAHGVTAVMVRRRASDAAAAILKEAHHNQADLVVMGVFGRSRLAEWVLGGVSHAMLRDSQIPLLIAH